MSQRGPKFPRGWGPLRRRGPPLIAPPISKQFVLPPHSLQLTEQFADCDCLNGRSDFQVQQSEFSCLLGKILAQLRRSCRRIHRRLFELPSVAEPNSRRRADRLPDFSPEPLQARLLRVGPWKSPLHRSCIEPSYLLCTSAQVPRNV